MPIVLSVYAVDNHAQIDGRRYVTETHVDQYGETYTREYLAAVGADYQAIADAQATVISQQLIDMEIEQVLNEP